MPLIRQHIKGARLIFFRGNYPNTTNIGSLFKKLFSLNLFLFNLPLTLSFSLALESVPLVVWAAPLISTTPGAADIGRVEQRIVPGETTQNDHSPSISKSDRLNYEAPHGSDKIFFVLKGVIITGSSVYSTPTLENFTKSYLGKKIALATFWSIAAQISAKYHKDGYFLTNVIVPQQEIQNGLVEIHIIEGRIGRVELDGKIGRNPIVKGWIDQLTSYKIIKTSEIEHILIELNSIPGVNLRAVLTPVDKYAQEGDVVLVLENRPAKNVSYIIAVDDFGSRYFGAVEVRSTIQIDEAPGFRGTGTILSSLSGSPANSLLFGSLKQDISILPATDLQLYSSYAKSNPRYDLESLDERSKSIAAGGAVQYDILRQRATILTLQTAFEAHNISTNVFDNVAQTRDRIRLIVENMNYQHVGIWGGQTNINIGVTRGLDVLGASAPQDPSSPNNHLSRADAKPNFTKVNIEYSRLTPLSRLWSVFIDCAAQLTPNPLYSLEQFGYGGQVFGRAYSDSEIIGDRGVAGDIEFRHFQGMPKYKTYLTEYVFFDAGGVWNNRAFVADAHSQSGDSAGFGVRASFPYAISSNIGLAFPLVRREVPPLYGNGKNPRPIFSLLKSF